MEFQPQPCTELELIGRQGTQFTLKCTWSILNLRIHLRWNHVSFWHSTQHTYGFCVVCVFCVCICLSSGSRVNGRYLLRLFDKHPITWTLPTAMRDISTSATTKVTIHSSLSPHLHLSLSPSCSLSPCLLVPQAFIPWMSHSVSACVKLVFWDP